MTRKAVNELIARRVAEVLEARDAARNLEPLAKGEDEQENKNGDDYEGRNGGGNGNGNKNGGVNGNGNGRGDGNGNGNENRGGNSYENNYVNFREGVIGLTCWFEKMETVFHISNYPQKYQVKYATYTLLNSTLTWWNSHKRTIRIDAAYAIRLTKLMKLMAEVYNPRNEIQNMETELWNLTMKGNDLTAYTWRFQELVLLCTRMVPDEEDKGYARNAKNKIRFDNNLRDNHGQQPSFKRQNVARTYTAKNNEKKRNKTRNNEAIARAYAIGGGGANPDSNVVMGMFLLNNCYAFMLFDSGADRSFVSSTFSALLDVTPSTLDTSYAVELADGRISDTNVILRGCMLGLLGHPFDIDLMPIKLGSFDIIIDMDWLEKYHAMIVCNGKIVHNPYGDEVLIIRAQVTSKKTDDKSKEKRLEDVPNVREFLEVFPEDLLRLPPAR
ncbi:putative reverse transcriptase domain-containing protein [Tanacetum coccineum]